MTSLFQAVTALVLTAFLCSCGLSTAKPTAEKAVETFHQEYNDKKNAEIYSSADAAFRSAAKEAEYNNFIQTVRSKMGVYKSSTESGYRTNATTSGTFVTLHYKSQFEHSEGTEDFTFVISGGTAKLQRYDVNSPLLPPS